MIWRKPFIFSMLLILVLITSSAVSYGYANDTDGDGFTDNDDLIPTADAGIKISINSLRVKDFVDGTSPFHKDTAQIFCKVYVDGAVVTNHLPIEAQELEIDEKHEVNWAVIYDAPDNIAEYTITIELFDKDNSSEEQLDINGADAAQDEDGYSLEVEYYLGEEIGRKLSGITDGSDDGNNGLEEDEEDAEIAYTISTVKINQPPTVSLTSPAENSIVSGIVTVGGTASDKDGLVQSVEVRIDGGAWQKVSGTRSWMFDWDTTQVDDGSHTILARSYDGCDYSTVQAVTVIVNNVGDQPPTVSISSPSDGDTVTSHATISGSASFSKGTMGGVQVKIDNGVWQTAAGTTSWMFEWDTTQVSDGNHTIHARSYDGHDYSDIESITVTVDNKEDGGGGTPGFQFVLLLAAAFIALAAWRRYRT